MPYGGENIINGVSAPYAMPNLWKSNSKEKLPQYINLNLKDEKEVNQVMITFDTDLSLVHARMPGLWRAPNVPSHWKLYIKTKEEQWKEVYEEKDNYERKRIVNLKPIKTSAIKIEILKLNGENETSVGIYEISIY